MTALPATIVVATVIAVRRPVRAAMAETDIATASRAALSGSSAGPASSGVSWSPSELWANRLK